MKSERLHKAVFPPDELIESARRALYAAGVDPDAEICFERLSSLYAAGLIDIGDVACFSDNMLRFDFVQRFTRKVLEGFVLSGVVFLSFDGVIISPFASIEEGAVIHPGTQIRHGVSVGKGCLIGPFTVLERCTVGCDTVLNAVQAYDSEIGNRVKVGPYCHIRPGSVIKDGVKIGDFVEIKNSVVGEDTHASHLTYIGDSDVGKRVNFGCGTVCVNYNGYEKNRCVIGDDAFIGCNTNLVAPVVIGNGGYTAAGSTITNDVPDGSLAIARARQVNKDGWADDFRKKHGK